LIEAGFHAAMNMMFKRVEFKLIPMTRLTVGNKEIYFVGERGSRWNDYHI